TPVSKFSQRKRNGRICRNTITRATSGTTPCSSRGNRGKLRARTDWRTFALAFEPARRKRDFESGRIQRKVWIVKRIVHEFGAPGPLHVIDGTLAFCLFSL